MLRSVKVAVSKELFKITNIESYLRQFKGGGGVKCDFVKISDQDDTDRFKKDIEGCDVALIEPWYFQNVGECLPTSLKWIQSAWAGVQQLNSLHPDMRHRLQRCTITRSVSAYGAIMAEYTIGAIIAMERNMPRIIRGNMEKSWLGNGVRGYRPLYQLSVGILGVGNIGKEVARLCSCLGMTVHGMKTSLDPVEHVDKVYTSNQLTELLRACDYVCNILPSTSKTKGLLSNGALNVCENNPIGFINIGRGDIIDETSLVEAVNNEWIEKAFLDVFEKEPLPAESPLWSCENVTITPHVSGSSVRDTIPAEFIENLENFINGRELKNTFRWDMEY